MPGSQLLRNGVNTGAVGHPLEQPKFHSARHFAVSNMLAEGVSPVEVAAYVGDTVETITRTYSHFLRGSESRAKRALDLALAPDVADPVRDTDTTRGSD